MRILAKSLDGIHYLNSSNLVKISQTFASRPLGGESLGKLESIRYAEQFALRSTAKELFEIKEYTETYFDDYVKQMRKRANIISGLCFGKTNAENYPLTNAFIAELLEDGFLIRMGPERYGISQNRLFELLGGNLAKAYASPALYSSPDMFSPPAERRIHVLRLELTQGCDHNSCTYCGGYKTIPYKEKAYDEFVQHYQQVKKFLGNHIHDIRRLFLGGANALSVELDTLEKAIHFLKGELYPRRIAIYGTTNAINEKGGAGLSLLKDAGLTLIYNGLESGSANVLEYVNKRTTPQDILEAGRAARYANIALSVMVMPGLGGIKYAQSHIDGTVILLNSIKTKFVTFMAVNPADNSAYARRMAAEVKAGTNRPLTDCEIVEQTREIVLGLEPNGQKVGMFDPTIDQVGRNPISFNVKLNYRADALPIIDICNAYLREAK